MKDLSLAGLFREFGAMAARAEAEERAVLTRAAKIVQERAKDIIGTYQDDTGPFAPWAQLADSTVAEKERLGYAPPDNPLLREGDLRDSIEYTVGSMEAHIGSNSEVAVYQELGTVKMPPRSFLGAAAFQKSEHLGRVMGSGLVAALIGESVSPDLPVISDGSAGHY